MKLAVLGTGNVGTTIGSKLIELGHEVRMGSRTEGNPKAVEWVRTSGVKASQGTFAEAASFGEMIFNCTAGIASIDVLRAAGEKNINGKILIDISNPLDFSGGMPPSLSVCNKTSLGEVIQNEFPQLKVVKTLNTMWCGIMVNPGLVNKGNHTVFVSGNDMEAKNQVSGLLKNFGWKSENILDLGDITTARGTEMYLPLWLRIFGSTNNGAFNLNIVR
jgi:predicted dinucleotide-binding enzyme